MCKRASIIICLDQAGVLVKNFLYMLSEYENLEKYQLIFAVDQDEEAYFRGIFRKYFKGQDVSCYKTQNIYQKSRVYNKACEMAHGDVVIFLDTNIVLLEHSMEELVDTLEEMDILAAQPLMIKYHASKVFSTGYVFSGNRSGHALENREVHEDIVNQSSVRNALAVSMLAINRYVFEELRGFNEDIPSEHIGRELTERITGLGYQNYYNHRAKVYYIEPVQMKDYSELQEVSGTLKMEKLVSQQLQGVSMEDKYAVLNFSEVIYVRELIRKLGFRILMCRNYNQWSGKKRIDFEKILPLSMTELKQDYLYVVNNFYQIKDNPLWFQRRKEHQDLIVDLSGNVICISDYWKE